MDIPPSICDEKYNAIRLLKRLFLTPNSVNAISLVNSSESPIIEEYLDIFSKGFVLGKQNILFNKTLD
jgi:hypothetical protein